MSDRPLTGLVHAEKLAKRSSISEDTVVPIKLVIGIVALVLAGCALWYGLLGRVDNQDMRITRIERNVCRIGERLGIADLDECPDRRDAAK